MMKGKLFYGGTIITMDDANSFADAVYVEDGIIRGIDDFETLHSMYKDAELVDLKGNTMMPGFFEPHAHYDLCTLVDQMHVVSGLVYKDSKDVIAAIKEAVAKTPKGHWVMCFGLDFLLNRDLPEINRYWLDEITCEHPLAIIIQSMHTLYANSYALKLAGIDRNTQDTRDGHCIKDENGEPLGILTEQGFSIPIVKLWLEDLHKNGEDFLWECVPRWVEHGVTTTWIAGYFPIFPNHIQLFTDFFNNPNCPIRGDYSISFNSIEKGLVDLEKLASKDTPKTKMTGVKSWYDGSPYTGNMLMYDNYLENDTMQKRLYIPPNQHGERLFDPEYFYGILKKYHEMGYQLSVHAQGDCAGHEIVKMFERLLKECPREDHRHRMEHCAFITQDDLKLAADLGLTISFHTNHLYYYGEALQELVIGEDKTEHLLQCGTAIRNGMKVSFHSDDPMYSIEPLRVAANAVTRTSRNGTVIGKDEAISLTDALRGITIDAAWQLFREDELGSIEVGKFADFTVIEENPYVVDPLKIGDIKIVTTYIDGVDTKTMNFRR